MSEASPDDRLLQFGSGKTPIECLPADWLSEDHIRALLSPYYPDVPSRYQGREKKIRDILARTASMTVGGTLVAERSDEWRGGVMPFRSSRKTYVY